MLNKAGGAGFQVTAYAQTWSDVEAWIGSSAKAGQIAGDFTHRHMESLSTLTLRRLADPMSNAH